MSAAERDRAATRRRSPVAPAPTRGPQDSTSEPGSLTSSPSQRAVLQLQSIAGNAAVGALLAGAGTRRAVQRLVPGGSIPPPPVAPGSPAPTQHLGFRATQARLSTARRQAAKHPPAALRAAEAGRAAKPPTDDKEAQAKTAKAGDMGAAPAGSFDKAAFIAAVSAAIAKAAPKNLEEADRFATSGRSDTVAAEVKGKVGQSKDASARPMAEASAKPPDTGRAVEKPVTPLSPPPSAGTLPALEAGSAMPTRAPAEQTELGHGLADTSRQMAEAEVTEGQLAASNEPEFTGALAAKKEGEQHSAAAPGAFRATEAQQLVTAQQGAQAAGGRGVTGMLGVRGAALQKVGGAQQKSQTKNEARRAEVSGRIRSIFDATKTAVDAILTAIDPQVDQLFTAGEARAKAAFTAHHKARMDRYKDDRYSGVLGAGRWIRDKFADLPSEVNAFYVEAKQIYETQMKTVISDIADTVGRELTKAKDRVSQGRKEITTYVGGLEPSLRSVGKEAATEIGSQFDTLDESVNEKSESLAEDLAEKYVTARTAVDDEIKALQEENRGLWSKAEDAIGGAIETILKLKNLLLGALSRAAGAISKIIKDPIGFLGNFVNAVKSGVMNFGSNILTHLKKGLQSWLFGTLADAGIEIPEKFDLKGIVGLILSMLGLTWASIRARLAKVLPEWVLKALETAVEVVKILSSEGVSGLWTWIVKKMADLKEQVMSQIKDFVITKIITAGITWLISLLNPAAAFIKACKMIYDAVMWFVDNAERMSDFVNSVLDSVESIASGGVGKVAGMIEATLGKAIPMVISGLASLLGLGGIADKIKSILETIQKPVGKVVDSIIGGVVKYGKKLLGKLKRKQKDPRSPGERKAALLSAMAAGQHLLAMKEGSESTVRSALSQLKAIHKVKRLDLMVDNKTQETATVHIVGANSPTVHGEPVVRRHLTLVRTDGDDVRSDGPKAELKVGTDIYTVWTVGGTSVRVKAPGIDTEVKSGASVEAAVHKFVGEDVGMDRGEAVALVRALQQAGLLSRELLLHYVHKKTDRTDPPEKFAASLVRENLSMTAAVQGPAHKATRDKYADTGIDEHGQEREGPLSNIAQVFYTRAPGEWKSRQIQSKANVGGAVGVVEFIWQGSGSRGQVVSLGTIEVDDGGLVVRVIDINSGNLPGGKSQLIDIMTAAGWTMAIRGA